MFEKILIAYDGSACARAAMATAMGLAKAERSKLFVCVVVDPIEIAGANAPMPPTQAALDAGRAHAQRLADDAVARAKSAGIDAEGVVVEGEPPYEILQTLQRLGADSIVIGTHGRSGVKRLFLGSVAEETLRSAHVPVVVVHDTSKR